MKKQNLHLTMLAGMVTGLLVSPQALKGEDKKISSGFLELVASTNGNIASRPLSKDDLMLELNQEGADLFNSLSPEGQQLALKIASRGCNGENDCKGQNACRTDKNKCAGEGECKGQTKCAVSDKNYAVKIAAKLMAKKRMELQQTSPVSALPTSP
jgi:hypothetical protein